MQPFTRLRARSSNVEETMEMSGAAGSAVAAMAQYLRLRSHNPLFWVLNIYYLCLAGSTTDAHRCCTAIDDNAWRRGPKFRVYCRICGARYRAKFGALCEMIRGGHALYCRARIPCLDSELMTLIAGFDHVRTVQELSAASRRAKAVSNVIANWLLPAPPTSAATARLMDRGALLTNPTNEGQYRLNHRILFDMPALEWPQVYNSLIHGVVRSAHDSPVSGLA